jgi:hypothetical protein
MSPRLSSVIAMSAGVADAALDREALLEQARRALGLPW